MQLNEIKQKAKSQEIKLEDLDIEDILKLTDNNLINYTLQIYFDLSLKEVKQIRKIKNITNIALENLIRNLIVIYDFLETNYPDQSKKIMQIIVPQLAQTNGKIHGKEDFFVRKISEINWNHMNPKQEIIKRKIDVQYRQEKLKEIIFILEKAILKNQAQKIIKTTNKNSSYKETYHLKKKPKQSKNIYNIKKYQRDRLVKIHALINANYTCELNPSHKTFISKTNGKPFMQAHHLIPLEFEYLFPYSLDVEANVVSLCSMCHDEIHYGQNYKQLIN